MRVILGATKVDGEGVAPAKWEMGPLVVSSSSMGSKREGHLSGSSANESSVAKRGEVSVLLAMYGES